MIPHPIINDVLDRAKRVENDAWLSSARHIQFPIYTTTRAKGLITAFFPISLILSKSPTDEYHGQCSR